MTRFRPNRAEADGTAKRRIYVLPNELVERIHSYGHAEADAVRRLLKQALDARTPAPRPVCEEA